MVINKVSAEGAIRTKVLEGECFGSKYNPLQTQTLKYIINLMTCILFPEIKYSLNTELTFNKHQQCSCLLLLLYESCYWQMPKQCDSLSEYSIATRRETFCISNEVWHVYFSPVHVSKWWTLDKALTCAMKINQVWNPVSTKGRIVFKRSRMIRCYWLEQKGRTKCCTKGPLYKQFRAW